MYEAFVLHVWRLEDNFKESGLSSHSGFLGIHALILKFFGKHFYSLSHLANPPCPLIFLTLYDSVSFCLNGVQCFGILESCIPFLGLVN